MKTNKILLVTNNYPPYTGGSSSILYEILSCFPKDELYVIHGCNSISRNIDFELPFDSQELRIFNSSIWTARINRQLPELLALVVYRSIIKALKQFNISRIYAHYPNAPYITAAYLAAKKHNLPLFIYLDILWEERGDRGELRLSRLFERRIFKYASKVFAITEFSVNYLSEKHGRNVHLIPHTINSKYIPKIECIEPPIKHKIHFAGGIYPRMNLDSILRLVEAIRLTGYEIELEICSSHVPYSIIKNEFVTVKYLSKKDLIASQSTSSILFLPQAFESDKPIMIKHNFPTKTMEYLCSQRPILIHSPQDSYLSYIGRKANFAEVVDAPDESALSSAIIKLLNSNNYQRELVNNAIKFVKTRRSDVWSNLFYTQFTEY